MQLPTINFAKRGELNRDFEAFMKRLHEGYACFIYLKKPKKGEAATQRTAYGTRRYDLINETSRPKAVRQPWMLKGDFWPYWDIVSAQQSKDGKGMRGFYENRWMGWYPEVIIPTEEEDTIINEEKDN